MYSTMHMNTTRAWPNEQTTHLREATPPGDGGIWGMDLSFGVNVAQGGVASLDLLRARIRCGGRRRGLFGPGIQQQ